MKTKSGLLKLASSIEIPDWATHVAVSIMDGKIEHPAQPCFKSDDGYIDKDPVCEFPNVFGPMCWKFIPVQEVVDYISEHKRVFKCRYEIRGTHVHCRLFSSKTIDQTFKKLGDVAMDLEDWENFQEQCKTFIFQEENDIF